ncbi:Protein OSB1, mitochondrial [Vitis vinifera]|uniref:Protein OSB1, mitochondrial n=1 Tax=Vitis vinifera TaxID=29760 RepID=A0A438ES90_VITVI|nr:Protein OSB1, mitochondrial [Vitis vinifera]
MEAFRLHALFKNIPPFSLQKLLHFSSSSAANPSARRFVSDDLSADGSSIYRHTLKFQRPTTIKWCDRFHNSVSFIGSVDRPLERRYTINGYLYVYTVLHVKPFREARRDVRIFLQMWDRMAEISFKHLKQNDLIHVSGQLGFYTKADDNGQRRPYHTVIVKELNYVTQFGQPPTYKKIENLESGGGTGLIKPKSRLYLWQVFFYNPDEWWDNRKQNNCNCTIREWQNWTKCDLLVFAPCLPCNCKVLGPNIPAGGCYVLACGFCLNEKDVSRA